MEGIRPLFSLDPRREALNPWPRLSKYLQQARSTHSLNQNNWGWGRGVEGRAGLSRTFSSKLALSIVDAILRRDLQTSKLNLRCYLQHYMARWNHDTCVSSPDLNSRICIKHAARMTTNKCSIRSTTSKAERLERLALFRNVAPHVFLVVTELRQVAALLGKCCV